MVLSYEYSKQAIFGLTQEWFRELSFSRLECGVHDKLHFSSADWWDLLLPLHRHQIERTDGFQCLLRKTQRYTISNVESQVFTPNIHAWSERDSNPDRRRDKRACQPLHYRVSCCCRIQSPSCSTLVKWCASMVGMMKQYLCLIKRSLLATRQRRFVI